MFIEISRMFATTCATNYTCINCSPAQVHRVNVITSTTIHMAMLAPSTLSRLLSIAWKVSFASFGIFFLLFRLYFIRKKRKKIVLQQNINKLYHFIKGMLIMKRKKRNILIIRFIYKWASLSKLSIIMNKISSVINI